MQKVTDNIFILVLLAMAGMFVLGASFIYFYVRYQRRIQSQKESMQEAELQHRENLLQAAIQSQEEERKRIGRDLHDDVGSALSNLRMVMGQIVSGNETVAVTESGNKYKPLIDNIINNVRNISHSLSPPGLELFGLEHTLHELCDNVNASGTLNMELQNNCGDVLDKIGSEKALAIYRVMQELVANTIKHAGAKNIQIAVDKQESNLLITYKDDGKGTDLTHSKKTGMGLQNIESRLRIINASYEIDSAPGKGFSVGITLS